MIIAQITDTHIVPKGQAWKSKPETKTAERLNLVVNHLNNLDSQPSVVLVTGDTIDEGGKEAYAHLKDLLSPLSMPYYVIPGNHDEPQDMRAAFCHETYMPLDGFIQYVIDDYPVRLIALDTVIAHQDQGTLCQERLDWLHQTLQKNTQKPTLIFMHHPPAKVGYAFLDSIRCFAPDTFEAMIQSSPNVIGILSGHYHKPYTTIFGKTLSFTAPSVAPVPYFKKEDTLTVAIDLAHPSFTLHRWTGGFNLVSEVHQAVWPQERISKTALDFEEIPLRSVS